MKKDTKNFEGYLLDAVEMRNNGHTKLLGFDNNTATYLNADGTKTIYISSVPIEKHKLQVQQKGQSYESAEAHVKIHMPKQLSLKNGITIGENLEILPIRNMVIGTNCIERTNAFGLVSPCVVYDNFWGKYPLYCYPTSFGINMEIVLPERTQNCEFCLQLKQPKEYFSETEPDYISFRNETDLQTMVYTPIAVDAKGSWNYQNRIVLSVGTNGKVIVHFLINQAFLDDPNTQYPVTLNQSVYIYQHKQPDTAVYSKAERYARHYLSPYLLLGENTSRGKGRALLRFEVLNELNISAEDVLKADYCFTNLMEKKESITVGAYAIVNDWCSVNTKWKNKPDYEQVPVGIVEVCKKGVYDLDITYLLREMLQNRGEYEPPHSVRNSFLLKSDGQEKDAGLLLASGDAGFYPPYLKLILKNTKQEK